MPIKRSEEKKECYFELVEPRFYIEDLIVSDDIRESLYDIISASKNYKLIYETWGMGEVIKKHNGISVNIYGESGTGKSMAAEVIASELGKKVLRVNYADIESKYVGETSKNLYRLFEHALEKDAVLIFDEADALLSKRVVNMNNSTDVSVNQTRSVLLNILDEFKGIVVFTTNFMNNYDKAFIRRIMFHLKMEMPNEDARMLLWKMYLGKKLSYDFSIEDISRNFDGITGADIINAIMNSAYYMARNKEKVLSKSVIEKNIIKIKNAKIENKMIHLENV